MTSWDRQMVLKLLSLALLSVAVNGEWTGGSSILSRAARSFCLEPCLPGLASVGSWHHHRSLPITKGVVGPCC